MEIVFRVTKLLHDFSVFPIIRTFGLDLYASIMPVNQKQKRNGKNPVEIFVLLPIPKIAWQRKHITIFHDIEIFFRLRIIVTFLKGVSLGES